MKEERSRVRFQSALFHVQGDLETHVRVSYQGVYSTEARSGLHHAVLAFA